MKLIDSAERPRGWRVWGIFAWALVLFLAFHSVIAKWLSFSWTYDHYSHLVLIPFISAYLLYHSRDQLGRNVKTAVGTGSVIAVVGLTLTLVAYGYRGFLRENDYLAISIAGLITLIVAGYVGVFGRASGRAALFPLLFLYLAVPIPMFLLDHIILALQHASADLAHLLFNLTGVPVLRDGFVFVLPGVSIEVARECSGIRSSLALFILAILCSHFFLRTNGRRVALLALIFPLLILKNAARIVTLTLLAAYVNPGFLQGSLHRNGGILFFAVTMLVLALILRLLRRSEPVSATPSLVPSS